MAQKRISDLAAASELSGAELLEVSQASTEVTITAATISANGADNSFSDSANGFLAAGFVTGDRVTASGFAEAANNITVGIVTTAEAGKLTIAGADGDVITNEAVGANVTISKWVSRRITPQDILALALAVPSIVKTEAENYVLDADDAGSYIRLTAAIAKTISVAVEPGGSPLPDNAEWHFRNVGVADAAFVPAVGVVINVPNGGTLGVPQGGTVTLKRVAANQYDLLGQTVAA